MPVSAYIHIPFCQKKCNYCAFVSFETLKYKEFYLKALEKQISKEYKGEVLKTLYIGGGTPSVLTVDEISKLLCLFNINKTTEITLEINPETVDEKYLTLLKNTAINRLSIGVQSFDDEILKSIGRIHTSHKAKECISTAQKIGFNNISLDFIYGLPSQSLSNFKNTLEQAIKLKPSHISLYGLKIEENTVFHRHLPKNLPDDDMQANMYLSAVNFLSENGFNHYEISNFSVIGFESKHNLNYWNNDEYYGFGLGAHGYIDGVRYSNGYNLQQYLNNPFFKDTEKMLSVKEILEEAIILGFRKVDGINVLQINKKFGINFDEIYKNTLNKFMKSGHIKKTPGGYCLSNDGFLLSNLILCEFL